MGKIYIYIYIYIYVCGIGKTVLVLKGQLGLSMKQRLFPAITKPSKSVLEEHVNGFLLVVLGTDTALTMVDYSRGLQQIGTIVVGN